MYKVLAGNWSATFNIDGGHLQRMLARGPEIIASACEQIILHDQVLVPANDYLTAAGLLILLGEKNVIELLESNELRFIRILKTVGYAQGPTQNGSLGVFEVVGGHHPTSAPIELSVARSLDVAASWGVRNTKKLGNLLAGQTDEVDAEELLNSVRRDSVLDLQQTSLWKDEFGGLPEGEFRLPGLEVDGKQAAKVKMLGPGIDTQNVAVDALLALVLANEEIHLGQSYECVSTLSGSPWADLFEIKRRRLLHEPEKESPITRVFELTKMPNLARLVMKDKRNFAKLRKLSRSRHGVEFRDWFQAHSNRTVEEILAAYIDLLHETPAIDKLPAKALRFVIGKAVDAVPPLGTVYSALDEYVVGRIFKNASPRYFLQGLRRLR